MKRAVIIFLYVERIKSELIIGSKLLEEIENTSENQREGAEKILLAYLEMLQSETKLAQQVSSVSNFENVQLKLESAHQNMRDHKYSEALKNISQAISLTTTIGQKSIEQLREKALV